MNHTLRHQLDSLYSRYNSIDFISPDPIQFLHLYEDAADREVVGLIASSLAFGRVAQILKSVSSVLERMPQPAAFLRNTSRRSLESLFCGFRHRFSDAENLVSLLWGIKSAIERFGSVETCFAAGLAPNEENIVPALGRFVEHLRADGDGHDNFLLPLPERGSACKRLNLFLRWMVRRDAVDPGGWSRIAPAKLLVPLDTHMHRTCRELAFTRRKQANLLTVIEVTERFRNINRSDPLRYDFALTRLGILPDGDLPGFIQRCRDVSAETGCRTPSPR